MSANPDIQILIVEDEPAHAEMVMHHLQMAGYSRLQVTSTLESCLQQIKASSPDVILIDLHLPDGGAMDLLSEVDGQIPIVTLTSRGSEEQAVEVLRAGALDYLTKSVETFAAIPRILDRALREWQLQCTNEEAMENLRHQKSLVDALLQNTVTPIFVIDPEHRVLLWNTACEKLTGVKAAEVVGTNRHWTGFYDQERPCLADIVLDGDPHASMPELYPTHSKSELLAEGLQAEGWRTNPAGRNIYLTFNAALARDSRGTVVGAIETLQDITERKTMEDELLASKQDIARQHEKLDAVFRQIEQAKQEWETTLDCIQDIVILTDQSGKILRCNRALADLVNLPITEVISKRWDELPGMAQTVPIAAHETVREFFHSPTQRWFLLSIYPFSSRKLDSSAFQVVTMNDRTVIKKMNDELEQANHQLQEAYLKQLQSEKMASIGQLAAGVAHEINNPIGFVSSNLGSLGKYMENLKEYIAFQEQELAAQADQDTLSKMTAYRKQLKIEFTLEDIPDLLTESQEGVDRVGKIVRDLKRFSRVDEAECKMANIIECLESAINIAWNEIKYKSTLSRDFTELPEIFCYPGQLNQIFVNLLVNAAQSIETHGTIELQGWADEEAVYIRISDTGCGISEENCKMIFDPFFTTKEVGKGTGLGLSIAYDIIKKHQGDISVESRIGEGTSFTIQLPIRSEEPEG